MKRNEKEGKKRKPATWIGDQLRMDRLSGSQVKYSTLMRMEVSGLKRRKRKPKLGK